MTSNIIDVYFDTPLSFEVNNIKPLNGIVGLYFIFSSTVQYNTRLKNQNCCILGMSEKKTNSIGSRLIGHFKDKSKNIGLVKLS